MDGNLCLHCRYGQKGGHITRVASNATFVTGILIQEWPVMPQTEMFIVQVTFIPQKYSSVEPISNLTMNMILKLQIKIFLFKDATERISDLKVTDLAKEDLL